MRTRKLVLFLALTAVSFAQSALEFSGYADFGAGIRVVITDLRSGDSSQWLKVGEVFQEHKLVAIDVDHDLVTLQRGSAILELPLKGTQIKNGTSSRAEARTKVLVRYLADADPAVAMSFISDSVIARFRTEILNRDSELWSDLISAEISRPISNSTVMQISIVALTSKAALGASNLLVSALIEKTKAHKESGLGISIIQRPTLVKADDARRKR